MKKTLHFFLWLFCAKTAFAQTQNTTLVIPIGHTNGITAVDMSPDGRYYLTGSLDQTIKIWDGSGHEIRSLVGHEMNVLAAAFSPKTTGNPEGGQFILSGSTDHKAILWDQFGKKLAEFSEPAENGDVTSVAFSPNGEELLLGLKDGTARLLNKSCVEIRRFPHRGELSAVAFSPDGTHILTACKDKTATLWKKSDNARAQHIFAGHSAAVSCAVFSKSGDSLLTGSADGTAILWKISGAKIRTFQHPGEVQSVAISPDGQKIATGSSAGTLKIWNHLTEDAPKTIKRSNRGVSSLKFSADSQHLLSSSDTDPAAQVTQLDGQLALHLKGYTSAISAMAISPDGSSLLVAHADSTAKIWDLSGQKIRAFRYPDGLESVAFSPKNAEDSVGGKFILTGCRDRVCRLQNLADNTVFTFKNANQGVFSSDGKSVLTGSADGTTQIWGLDATQVSLLWHTERRVTALAFSPAKAFAIGSRNGVVVYWDSLAAQPVSIHLSTSSAIESLAFSPDGKTLACGVKGGVTEILSLETRRVTQTSRLRRLGSIRAIAFFPKKPGGEPDSKRVLRAAGNHVEIWNPENNSITTFSGHISDVTALAFSPEGDMFYSGSEDGTIKIWDVAAGKEIATLVSIGTSEWAVSTPQGLYDASTEAMKMMHYVVGMDVVLLRQIKERYWDPGLLAKVAGFSEDSIRDVPVLNEVAMFPDIKAKIEGNQLQIALTERNGGLGRLSLYINGKRIERNLNPDRLLTLPPVNLDLDKYTVLYRSDTTNTIGLVAYNAGNWLRSQVYEMPYQPIGARGEPASGGSGGAAPSDCKSSQPSLYLLVVGTSKYLDASKNLAYPDKDAAEMAKALGATGKAMFGDRVHLKHLSTAGGGIEVSSKENIKKAFDEFANQATPCDVLVTYFSGHGSTWESDGIKSNFYYLTKDISSDRLRDKAVREAYAISDVELEEWLNDVHALKQVLIIDACNSGKAVDNIGGIGQKDLNSNQAFAMGILNDRTGALIITGSLADMLSYEASKFGQGLLTYSLLRGMSGPGLKGGKFVDVMTLFQHARDEVPRLAEGIKQKQTPVIASEGDSFPIGIKDSSVTIIVATEKPMFIQSKFIDTDNIKDTLGTIGLGKALNQYFFEQMVKGKYVYYDTPSLSDGYSIEGTYTIQGETVVVKANLFRGEKPIGTPFEVKSVKKINVVQNEILKIVIPRVPLK